MTLHDISFRVITEYAAELRNQAEAAGEAAARAEIDGRIGDADHWEGRRVGLMDAHELAMAVLTAGRPPISVGDEVRFLWPDQAKPGLTDIDAHYDVMKVKYGMVAVKRTIYRLRGEMRAAWHWAPLTAVERCSDGHRCPDAHPLRSVLNGGA